MKTWEVSYEEIVKSYEEDMKLTLSDEAKKLGKVAYVFGKVEGILTGHTNIISQVQEMQELVTWIEELSINIHFKNNNLFN